MTAPSESAGLAGIGVRAAWGALWSGANALMMKLAGIAVMVVVVVRLVTPHEFGVFAAALVVHAIVSSFGELGLSSCVALAIAVVVGGVFTVPGAVLVREFRTDTVSPAGYRLLAGLTTGSRLVLLAHDPVRGTALLGSTGRMPGGPPLPRAEGSLQ